VKKYLLDLGLAPPVSYRHRGVSWCRNGRWELPLFRWCSKFTGL